MQITGERVMDRQQVGLKSVHRQRRGPLLKLLPFLLLAIINVPESQLRGRERSRSVELLHRYSRGRERRVVADIFSIVHFIY